ncbi:MAG: DUF2726 domain-containing protein [Burkholderiales bacterium]
MTTLQIALGLLAVLLLTVWWWLRRRDTQESVQASAPSERIDTITGWPPQATRVLTSRERVAFGTLVRALPEYMVLAQVPMSRFLSVPKRNSYADWLRRVGYQCVDFAVCDMAAQVIAVVELQPEGAQSDRARKRMTRMSRSLQAASIPLLIWRADALPSVGAARDAILPKPPAISSPFSTSMDAPAAVATPTAIAAATARNPFDDTGRDSTQDEMIELLEPPPSTWFDDLDSEPAPLRKN